MYFICWLVVLLSSLWYLLKCCTVIVTILFLNRKSNLVFLLEEAEIMGDADCGLMETLATKCGLESTVWLTGHSVSTLSAQQWGESFSYWSVLSYQTQKPLKLGNLCFKQIFDPPPHISVCVWTESKAYQLLKQSAMQTRPQIREELDDDSDSLSGKRCALSYLWLKQWSVFTHAMSHIENVFNCVCCV